jgi:hypothetical protein
MPNRRKFKNSSVAETLCAEAGGAGQEIRLGSNSHDKKGLRRQASPDKPHDAAKLD